MREPTQFEHLQTDVEVFADLESPIHVFDRGYLDYDRFCELKVRETDYISFLQADARVDVLEHIQDIEITNEQRTRYLRDDPLSRLRRRSGDWGGNRRRPLSADLKVSQGYCTEAECF